VSLIVGLFEGTREKKRKGKENDSQKTSNTFHFICVGRRHKKHTESC
jgi:hypothetical protein